MARSRLTQALADGLVSLPDGPICVFGAPAGFDLSSLPKARVTIAQRMKAENDAWAARGYATSPGLPDHAALSIVVLPRSKSLARAILADLSRRTSGPVVVDGQKTDGIDSLFRDLRKRTHVSEALSLAHGKLFVIAPGADLSDWVAGPVKGPEGFITAPGVFSEGKIDAASRLLAENLPPLAGRVADFGAGWGYLSRAILASGDVTSLDLVEADHAALECARLNITDPRAAFLWADATRHAPEVPYDAIVMNPPFHQGRAAEPALGQAFIRAAASALAPRGQLMLVANRHLPYEPLLGELFRDVSEIPGSTGFKLLSAHAPKVPPRQRR